MCLHQCNSIRKCSVTGRNTKSELGAIKSMACVLLIYLHLYWKPFRERERECVFMCIAGQCLLRLTVVMARAFQTKISQNALQPKQSGVLCDMLYFRNNSSSGMTATLLLIYLAGLLENTHTHRAKPRQITQMSIWIIGPPRSSHVTLPLAVHSPVNHF